MGKLLGTGIYIAIELLLQLLIIIFNNVDTTNLESEVNFIIMVNVVSIIILFMHTILQLKDIFKNNITENIIKELIDNNKQNN